MTAIDLLPVAIPAHLRLDVRETHVHAWCLVRYTGGGAYCGPLSPMGSGIGFPDGHVGVNFLTFPSAAAAQQFADALGASHNVSDRPERVCEQHFRVRVYKHDDGTELVLYGGSDPLQVRTCYLLALGLVQAAKMNAQVVIEARPLTIYHPLHDALLPKVTP
jgi:hypothetical protein